MMFDNKNDAVNYLRDILEQDIEIGYMRLRTFLQKHSIGIESVEMTEIRGRKELSLVSIDRIHRDGSIDITLNTRSLMHDLPMLYHKKDFLKRYLFGIQSSMLESNLLIDTMEHLFQAQNTGFIDWLSTWFGIRYGNIADDQGKRRVLAHAVELYRSRGTKGYFIRLVKALVDVDITIDDNHYSQYNQKSSTNKQKSFTVIIDEKISNDSSEESRKFSIIKNIFETEKPVNTVFTIEYRHGTVEEEHVEQKVIAYANDPHTYDYDSKYE